MADIQDLADQLVNLTIKEANELAQYLEDEYDIQPASAGVAVAAGGGAGGDGEAEREDADPVGGEADPVGRRDHRVEDEFGQRPEAVEGHR